MDSKIQLDSPKLLSSLTSHSEKPLQGSIDRKQDNEGEPFVLELSLEYLACYQMRFVLEKNRSKLDSTVAVQ